METSTCESTAEKKNSQRHNVTCKTGCIITLHVDVPVSFQYLEIQNIIEVTFCNLVSFIMNVLQLNYCQPTSMMYLFFLSFYIFGSQSVFKQSAFSALVKPSACSTLGLWVLIQCILSSHFGGHTFPYVC